MQKKQGIFCFKYHKKMYLKKQNENNKNKKSIDCIGL